MALKLAADGSKACNGKSGTAISGRVSDVDAQEAITQAHRQEWARVVPAVARRFGDLDVTEDATAEAFAIAVRRWPSDGVPPKPLRLADHHRQPQSNRPDPTREVRNEKKRRLSS